MTPVKQARKRKNLTIYQVAKTVGLSAASISRIESGKQGASKTTATKLSRALGIAEKKVLYPERYVSNGV
jgi:transcriptional regulator with XRE-family HTH domain